ncbi:hypothetical protein TIFTF001_045980 [Ficus carica]|uniref:Uncharacterized protein n=1 Tax=Ficus carica TaxID=3494 RepID=A0AA87Z5D0_FICCA|nr:hypothetical protein TIFTF001_045974 [Ficus carica]GMN25698.1 hypothetical protein TIFTF001_045976 [Ficus carica]GMN25715.1 hypothetical protein TIFTF001_045978 [Ficus carica]GMN25735.1 hypothetical protein TIFTF001_045980 [Ficus carica]
MGWCYFKGNGNKEHNQEVLRRGPIATLFVSGCSIRWWRLRWAVTMGNGGSSGLEKLGSRFSFVIDIRLLFFNLQHNGGCDSDLVVSMLPPLRGRRRRWAASNSDLGLRLG